MGLFVAKVAVVRRPSHLHLRTVVHSLLWAGLISLSAWPARAQTPDGIAAVVNDKVITYSDIEEHVSETKQLLAQKFTGEDLVEQTREAELNVLHALIDRQLILDDFKKAGGMVPETFTNERIADIIRDDYGGDRVAFIKTLYERGTTLKNVREELTDNTIIGYMRNKNVTETTLVSPYQIEQYYQQNLRLFVQDEQIKVSTIVLQKALFPSQRTDKDGKQVSYDPQEEIAKEIVYKLDTGSNFADLAKSYSEGSNKDDGGELGWVAQTGKTAIRADLWPYIEKLEPGQHTEVIPTSDGYYYILEVEDRKKATVTPLEDVRAQIEQSVINQSMQLRQQEWMDSLRAKAFIKMFL